VRFWLIVNVCFADDANVNFPCISAELISQKLEFSFQEINKKGT
jgi:hypothetical protein